MRCERTAAVGAIANFIAVGVHPGLWLGSVARGRAGSGLPGIPAGVQDARLAYQVLLVLSGPGEELDRAGQPPSVEGPFVVGPVLQDQGLHPAAAGQVFLAFV